MGLGSIASAVGGALFGRSTASRSPVQNITNNPVQGKYDDTGLKNQIAELTKQNELLQQQAKDFGEWRQSRIGDLGREAGERATNRALVDQLASRSNQAIDRLGSTQSGFREQLGQLGSAQSGFSEQLGQLGQGYENLTDAQKRQINELYNLTQGGGATGIRTDRGLTFTAPRGMGTGNLNRDSLTFGSLNI